MVAGRALNRRFCPFVDVTANQTLPVNRFFSFPDGPLLELVKIGLETIQVVLFDLSDCSEFRRSSLSSGIDVEVKAPGKADALADALELELLIVNLLKNAAAASKDSREKLISVQLSEEANEWLLSVSDHGQVISDKLLSRLSHPAKSLSDGLGLGLSICRLIAENHGGKLTFKPNNSKGLIVTLHLPKANKEI